MEEIILSVLTREGTVFSDRVSSANLPTDFGSLGILRGHAPMLCAVSRGVVRCTRSQGGEARIRIGEGIASVEENHLTVLVSDAELLKG